MSENLSLPEDAVEKKVYPSVSEYLSAFEESSQFQEALAFRKKELDFKLSQADLINSLRLSPNYRSALIDFYRTGNILPNNLASYSQDAREAITQYWNFIKSIPNHINVVRATARDKDDEETKLFRMEKTRDRFHTFAGLALLGDGVALKNGQKIICQEMNPQEESALDLESYSVLGRTLVSIVTEENALDIVDSKREEKKTAATLDFLNGCRYSSGHWVAKGEQ